MENYLIKNTVLVNDGALVEGDLLIKNGRIDALGSTIATPNYRHTLLDAKGQYALPGLIDDQVHFREPGLTHKGEIQTESRAAVAGGITSYMEMPNTVPGAVTIHLLEEKYARAAQCSAANYSFFMGTTHDNLEELLRIDKQQICGVKIFMGSSTGNMLVSKPEILERIFSQVDSIIAVHCEDDPMIEANLNVYRNQFGENIPVHFHPLIRSREACYKSSSYAVGLAKRHGTRLHILHISTAEELALFDHSQPLEKKQITAEACIHHLWFTDADYASKGTLIKWNPAIKSASDRKALRAALTNGIIDVVATDHAPHTLGEKGKPYTSAPSGGPLVQHSMQVLFELHKQGVLSIPDIAKLGAHHPALLFKVKERGFLREGYFADIVLFDPNKPDSVTREGLLYKCGWSPFEGTTFGGSVTHTWVNGRLAYQNGYMMEGSPGMRLSFDR
jgi:dihydroorotase